MVLFFGELNAVFPENRNRYVPDKLTGLFRATLAPEKKRGERGREEEERRREGRERGEGGRERMDDLNTHG